MRNVLMLWLLLLPSLALAKDPMSPVRKLDFDVDGDGKPESITLDGTAGAFTLKVGTATVTQDVPSASEIEGFTVQDVDASDKKKEIVVHTLGEMDDDHLVIFYGFDGKKLTELGRVPPFEELKGNGVILVTSWAGFYARTEKHVLDAKTQKIKAVPAELYYVGVEGKVKRTFPLLRSRTPAEKAVIANVAENSTVLVLACAPSGGKDPMKDWFLVKTASGLLGWTTLGALSEGVDLPFAG